MTLRLTTFTLILVGFLIIWHTIAIADDRLATDFIEFTEEPDQDCEEKGGLRIFVHNRHQQQIIDLHLDRYFADVRQGGRSMFALAPGHAQPLGCSRVFETSQYWKTISAEYISASHAQSRYGEVIGGQQ